MNKLHELNEWLRRVVIAELTRIVRVQEGEIDTTASIYLTICQAKKQGATELRINLDDLAKECEALLRQEHNAGLEGFLASADEMADQMLYLDELDSLSRKKKRPK